MIVHEYRWLIFWHIKVDDRHFVWLIPNKTNLPGYMPKMQVTSCPISTLIFLRISAFMGSR